MNRRILPQWVGLFVLTAVICVSGCEGANIFSSRAGDDNVDDLILEGQGLLRETKYTEALAKFNQAITASPLNSDALFFGAKAEFLASGFSAVELLRDITTDLTTPGTVPIFTTTRVIGFKPTLNRDEQSRLYYTTARILARLQPIVDGRTTGSFDAEGVSLEAAVARMVNSLLTLKDTNKDGAIDSQDFDFVLVKDGDDYEFELTSVDTPEKGNQFNDVLNDFTEGNSSLLNQVLNDLDRSGLLNNLGDTSIDLATLESEIEKLGIDLKEYFVNTGTPGNLGEGDNDNDGSIDEEILNGIDDDNDGKVDEDARLI